MDPNSESDADDSKIFHQLLDASFDKSKTYEQILINLENKFYVSSKNKSLYGCVVNDSLSHLERGFSTEMNT